MNTTPPTPPTQTDDPAPPSDGGGTLPDVSAPTPTITTTSDGDLADSAPAGAQLQTRPFVDAYNDLKNNTDQFFLVPGYGNQGPHLFQTWGEYFFLKGGFVRDLPPANRPSNADSLPGAGQAVVKATTTLPEAAPMKVDPAQLSHDLAVLAYWVSWQEAVDWMSPMIKLNRAHAEQKIATTVTKGLDRVEGILPENSALRLALGKALKWQNNNADKAQETRRDHAKLTEKLQGSGTEPPPAAGTGTDAGTGTGPCPRPSPAARTPRRPRPRRPP
jgi:hypothetical protein